MKRFFDKVNKTDSCWEWTASTRSGYGAFKLNGKVYGAHRISWLIHNNEWFDNKDVCHTCDNRSCVNPDHLFIGSRSDNMMDASNKGRLTGDASHLVETRFKKGHKPANRKLSDLEVLRVKKSIKDSNLTLKEISCILNISYQTIRNISCGRTYCNI